jgi:hypothetical protein
MWCSWSADHPWDTWFSQIWLHTRRYESRKKTESLYILGYLLELIIEIWRFGFYYFWNLANLSHFFSMKNPLYRSKPYFSRGNLQKKRKETLLPGRLEWRMDTGELREREFDSQCLRWQEAPLVNPERWQRRVGDTSATVRSKSGRT